jgi:predicted metal-dependent enzyme (double-stranded beta helix superfamily)
MSDPFGALIAAIDPLIRLQKTDAETVTAVEPHLRQLVSQRDWLKPAYRRAIPSKPYAQYLLFRPPDHIFSVVSFVWNPGQGSPIHDHCTWGVIGQYEGEEEEGRFRIGNRLEQIKVTRARPGDVSHVYPPERDIHQIMNRTASPTISIHIYGGDIGSQRRHVFDPATGRTQGFVSGYDIPDLGS